MNEQVLTQRPLPGARLNMAHPLTRGLVGCWLLNEQGGMRAMDISPYGRHGLMTGFSTTGLPFNGLLFPASPYITVPSHAGFSIAQTNKLTVETWAMTTTNAQTVTGSDILAKYTTANQREWVMYENGGGKTFFRSTSLDGLTVLSRHYVTSPTANAMHHYVITLDFNVAIKFYIDGQLRPNTEEVAFNGAPALGTSDLTMGKSTIVAALDGSMYLARIWDRVLNATEVQNIYISPYGMVMP